MPQPGTNDFQNEDSENNQTNVQIDDTDGDLVHVSLVGPSNNLPADAKESIPEPSSTQTLEASTPLPSSSATGNQPSKDIKSTQPPVASSAVSEAIEVKHSSDEGLRRREPTFPKTTPLNIAAAIKAGPTNAATFGWTQCWTAIFSACRKRGNAAAKTGLENSSTNTQLTR